MKKIILISAIFLMFSFSEATPSIHEIHPQMSPVFVAATKTKEYYKVQDYTNWEWAGNRCKQLGMSLVTIKNQKEMDFIRIHFDKESIHSTFWTSGYDEGSQKNYRWASGKRVNFKKNSNAWAEGNPSKRNCILYSEGFLETADCDKGHWRYVCEKKLK